MKRGLISLLTAFMAFSMVQGQKKGTNTREQTLEMSFEKCTKNGGCVQQRGGVTIDGNWRWLHNTGGYTNCYTGNEWNHQYCPNNAACTRNCALDGVDTQTYSSTYGIHARSGELELKFVTHGQYSDNIGSRTFLLDSSHNRYEMFHLLNQEFAFDVDVSNLPCGLNGALYFVAMDPDGGQSKYPTNECGAQYGTGYCDAQCPHDMKWINGEANAEGWTPSSNDKNAGVGKYGSCCAEMDIWEANSQSQAYTSHPCSVDGAYRCEGKECGDTDKGQRFDGVCDKDGCDFGSWRLGDKTYYGKGSVFQLDTSQKMTVVTQFITEDGTEQGDLAEIRRLYVQNNNVIANSKVNFEGIDAFDSVADDFCPAIKKFFGDNDHHGKLGGVRRLGEQMKNGMVLVMSLWDDHAVNMLWLDSDYPLDADPTKPGINRGPCSRDSGKPEDVERNYPNSSVKFSKIRIGDIDSTY